MKRKVKIDFRFIIIFLLTCNTILLSSNYFNVLSKYRLFLKLFVYVLAIFYIFINLKIKKKNVLPFGLITTITFASSIMIKNYTMLESLLIYLIFKTKNDDKTLKYILFSIVVWLSVVLLLFIHDYNSGNVAKAILDNGRLRYSIGYDSPNTFCYFAIWAYLLFLYFNHSKIKKMIIPTILIIIIFHFTDTRSMLYLLGFTIILIVLLRYSFTKKIIDFLSKYLLYIILIFLFVSIFLYSINNPIGISLDVFFNNRIRYCFQAITKIGVKLLNYNYFEYSSYGIIMDVSYINIICRFGILYYIPLIILVKKISNSSSGINKVLIILWMLYAMSETGALNLLICFPPLLAAIDEIPIEDKKQIESKSNKK